MAKNLRFGNNLEPNQTTKIKIISNTRKRFAGWIAPIPKQGVTDLDIKELPTRLPKIVFTESAKDKL